MNPLPKLGDHDALTALLGACEAVAAENRFFAEFAELLRHCLAMTKDPELPEKVFIFKFDKYSLVELDLIARQLQNLERVFSSVSAKQAQRLGELKLVVQDQGLKRFASREVPHKN